jgi:hypothetical protein
MRSPWQLTLLLSAIACAVPAEVARTETVATEMFPVTLVEERTYLKAADGQRENLARFIIANWFEMDRLAMAEKPPLFTRYRLFANASAEQDWDLVVVVGYPVANGFDDADTQLRFNRIRSAHKTILIDGKGLRELGAIVRVERARPLEGVG